MSQKKFEEIKKANQAAAKKLVEEHFSSSSEEEGDEDFEGKRGEIVANTFITYTTQTGTVWSFNFGLFDLILIKIYPWLFKNTFTLYGVVFAS